MERIKSGAALLISVGILTFCFVFSVIVTYGGQLRRRYSFLLMVYNPGDRLHTATKP